MIKGIVFDLDGTLVNTAGILAEAWSTALNENGFRIGKDELYKNTKGLSAKDIVKKYAPQADDALSGRIKDVRTREFLRGLTDSILFPETKPVLKELRDKGLKTGIATGAARKTILNVVMERTGLGDLMDTVVNAEDVAAGKPAPDVFLEAFRRLSVEPKDGMVVGDSYNDVAPAKEIGSFAVFISREGETLDMADANITNLGELMPYTELQLG